MDTPTPPDELRHFPVEAAEAHPPRTLPPPPRGVFVRYVLPVALFLAIVAATAWVTQFMPGWKTRTANTQAPKKTGDTFNIPVAIQFTRTTAVWDPKDETFVRPFERGKEGHYDFPFRNVAEKDVVLGLEQPSCDCVSIQVCKLPTDEWTAYEKGLIADPMNPPPFAKEPNWETLEKSPNQGITLPPDGRGLLRINWNSRKGPGSRLNLKPKLWSEPVGDSTQRSIVQLTVPTTTVFPYVFDPEKVSVGAVGKRDMARAEFDVWSITRKDLNFKIDTKSLPPFFQVQMTSLDEAALASLYLRIKESRGNYPPLSGYHVTVTVTEEKEGKEMDLGPFSQYLDVLVDEVPADGPRPQVVGRIKGEVDVGGADDNGRIDLKSFKTRDGKREVIPIWADVNFELELKEQHPATLEVKLRKDSEQLRPDRTKWLLEIVAPPDSVTGTLPDSSAIVLRLVGPMPRVIRIPMTGVGISN